MESPKICPICREPCLSNFSTIFQKAADGITEARGLKNDNFTVTSGIRIHVGCRKNYARTLGVSSSCVEVFDRRTRTSFGEFNFRNDYFYCGYVIKGREKKLRNHLISLLRTERLISSPSSPFLTVFLKIVEHILFVSIVSLR